MPNGGREGGSCWLLPLPPPPSVIGEEKGRGARIGISFQIRPLFFFLLWIRTEEALARDREEEVVVAAAAVFGCCSLPLPAPAQYSLVHLGPKSGEGGMGRRRKRI